MEGHGISSVEKQCQNSISFTSALSLSISRVNIKTCQNGVSLSTNSYGFDFNQEIFLETSPHTTR